MKKFLTLLAVTISISAFSQTRIDSTINFQTDPIKQYSIYVPSTYNAATPSKMMVGLHPFNTARWNSISWCDTLIAFAETNNLLLICPDGGADGQVDDDIDTAFTSAIIDSMFTWYNVDTAKIFAMGFSWGGKTTYSYGLRRPNLFAGYMPIGAVITTSEVSSFIENADGKPFYLVHGSQDNPGAGYTSMLTELDDYYACTNGILLSGVGHTIDFPNRNQILTDGFMWLDSVTCEKYVEDTTTTTDTTTSIENSFLQKLKMMQMGSKLVIENSSISPVNENLEFYSLDGKLINRVPLIIKNTPIQIEIPQGNGMLIARFGDQHLKVNR